MAIPRNVTDAETLIKRNKCGWLIDEIDAHSRPIKW